MRSEGRVQKGGGEGEGRLLREGRVEQDVREKLDSFGDVLLKNLGVIHSLLPGGVRIQVRPHVLYFCLQLQLGAFRSALEGHVLQEVRHPVVCVRLISASCVNPHANRGSIPPRGFAGHPKFVRKGSHLGRLLSRQGAEQPCGRDPSARTSYAP